MTNYLPKNYHTLTPSLVFKDSRRAIDFYKRAFGAKENEVFPGPDGRGIMHAEIQFGDSILMLGDENPMSPMKSAETLGEATASLAMYVPNVDTAIKQALNAGAKPDKPVQEMFWGDRAGSVTDPFGYTWWILTHVKDVSHEEMQRGAEQMFQTAGKK